jgi:thioredoxin reductase (NADPH)
MVILMNVDNDVIVIGLGPAGYSAGIYATRYNLDVLMIGMEPGGIAAEPPEIENYPGFEQISGKDLMDNMNKQFLGLGGKVKNSEVSKVEKINDVFEVTTSEGVLKAHCVILALGTKRRLLQAEGENKFKGRGVSYCATCDAPFFKDKTVAVIGGGDSAIVSALHLLQFVKKLYLVHRRDEFKAEPARITKLKNKDHVEFILNSKVNNIDGNLKVEKLILENSETGKERELEVDGVFISIGYVPSMEKIQIPGLDVEKGYIKVNQAMSTNIEGLFAAGDCTDSMNKFKQITTAVAGGSIAAQSAYHCISSQNKE